MKKLLLVLLLFSSFGLFAEKPVVAVLEIENKTSGKSRLSSDEVELIAELMRSELIQTDEFNVMRKDEMEAAIAQHVKKSHQLNRDSKYAIELGKTISARYIIISKILKDGKKFRISAEMINTEIGSSPHSGNAKFTLDDDDSKDIAIASLIKQLLGERDESLRPKKSEGQMACEEARAVGSEQKWKGFLKYYADEYPECVLEAKKQLEEIAYHKAERENSVESWTEYLDEYPLANKRHTIEAEEQIEKLKKAETKKNFTNSNSRQSDNVAGNTGNTIEAGNTIELDGAFWSQLSDKKLSFKEADAYCSNLNSGGYNDWHLPAIDDLRTLIQNCPNLETDGTCRLSENGGCLLARKCLNKNNCKCSTSGKYSKLHDSAAIWSASVNSSDSQEAYFIDFGSGKIDVQYIGAKAFVRCTR